ncbi:hypothetical protein GOBAR_DD34985 [Gossypium barbadense]|nr:hypothetical protein GOBAR_DD34985 [Gossypium barbadense]
MAEPYIEKVEYLDLLTKIDCKDSWPGLWDISSAGHISAGDSSLITAYIDDQLKARHCTFYIMAIGYFSYYPTVAFSFKVIWC